jgi:hypothetical protein
MSERRRVEPVDLSGADIPFLNLQGARVRGMNLTGAHITDAFMPNTVVEGMYAGLSVNGVRVAPHVFAEIRRMHPLLAELAPTTADGMRRAFEVVYGLWDAIVARVRAVPEDVAQTRVDDEWSTVETLRHLVFATDGWILRTVADDPNPFHPWGLPPPFWLDTAAGIDHTAKPSFADAVTMRNERVARVRAIVAGLTDADLDEVRHPSTDGPPPGEHKVGDALRTILDEEYWHSTYVTRDLDVLTAG